MLNRANNKTVIKGFTLIELLVVIAIIGILVTVVSSLASRVYGIAKTASETSALRTLLTGYATHTTENKGVLLPGYPDLSDSTVYAPNGEELFGPAKERYPWRIAPYLDDAMNALYVNDQLEKLKEIGLTETYQISLYPSFGLNSEWLGGDYRSTSDPILEDFGYRLAAKSMGDVKKPTQQIVFASAKAPGPNNSNQGYFELKSSHLPLGTGNTWRWHTINSEPSNVETTDSADHGNLSCRHSGEVLSGHLDGSIESLSLKELADMRRWTPFATSENWSASP